MANKLMLVKKWEAEMIIKRFNPTSVSKLCGILYAAMGFIVGAILALVSLIYSGMGAMTAKSGGLLFGTMFGVGAVIFLPLLYGVMGLVMGFIGAVIYNWVAGKVGGIEIETD